MKNKLHHSIFSLIGMSFVICFFAGCSQMDDWLVSERQLSITGETPLIPATSVRHIEEFFYPNIEESLQSVPERIFERCQRGEPVHQHFLGQYAVIELQPNLIQMGGVNGVQITDMRYDSDSVFVQELKKWNKALEEIESLHLDCLKHEYHSGPLLSVHPDTSMSLVLDVIGAIEQSGFSQISFLVSDPSMLEQEWDTDLRCHSPTEKRCLQPDPSRCRDYFFIMSNQEEASYNIMALANNGGVLNVSQSTYDINLKTIKTLGDLEKISEERKKQTLIQQTFKFEDVSKVQKWIKELPGLAQTSPMRNVGIVSRGKTKRYLQFLEMDRLFSQHLPRTQLIISPWFSEKEVKIETKEQSITKNFQQWVPVREATIEKPRTMSSHQIPKSYEEYEDKLEDFHSLSVPFCTDINNEKKVDEVALQELYWYKPSEPIFSGFGDKITLDDVLSLISTNQVAVTSSELTSTKKSNKKSKGNVKFVVPASECATLIEHTVRQRISDVKNCYSKELRSNPTLEGLLGIEFVIKNKAVEGFKVAKNTTKSKDIETCVEKKITRLTFLGNCTEELVSVLFNLYLE
jgi:hypothetical protein